ncbi:DNA repair protein RecO [Marinilabiliaceae bacterium ANBcel2]|nr:DNA repair protein RecO [Marinilabiliaceae bacterium ANBcel2]
MLCKTSGVVLNHYRYGESSAIVHIYSKDLGLQSYMVKGAFGRNKKSNFLLLQPLNIVDMVVYINPRKEIQTIKEFRPVKILFRIPFSQSRRAQAFLITELLGKVLQNDNGDESLFSFLQNSISVLDSDCCGIENFHIWFIFNLSRYLGFLPQNNCDDFTSYFDFYEACFVTSQPLHPHYLAPSDAIYFKRLFDIDIDHLPGLASNIHQRRLLLDSVILLYKLHQPAKIQLKSLSVLKELFH